MSHPGRRQPKMPLISERTDIYLMQPRNSQADNMKTRLGVVDTLNLQEGPVLVRAGKFHPRPGAVLVYHLYRMADIEMVRQQILDLARSSHGNFNNVVVCGIRGEDQVRKMIEALPQTTYVPGDVPGHDSDLILLKMIRRWKDLAVEASDQNESDTSPFIEVKAPAEQRRLVKDAVDSRAGVTVSPYGSTHEVKGYFLGFDENTETIRCQLEGHREEIEKCLRDSAVSKRLALSLALKQSRVFFATTAFHWVKDSVLEMKAPSLLYFVQRRKNFRHVVYAEGRHALTIRAGKAELFCDIHDISVGGLSIICTAEELKRLKDEAVLKDGSFQIEGQTVQIDQLKIRHARKFRAHRGSELFHVGLSFEKIAPKLADTLGKFVNERAARYFQTYLVRR